MIKNIQIQETRELVYYRDEGKCQNCGKTGNMNELQLAHRIPRTRTGLVINEWFLLYHDLLTIKQAEDILNNPINLKLSCADCNSSFLVTNKPEEIKKILDWIKNNL